MQPVSPDVSIRQHTSASFRVRLRKAASLQAEATLKVAEILLQVFNDTCTHAVKAVSEGSVLLRLFTTCDAAEHDFVQL